MNFMPTYVLCPPPQTSWSEGGEHVPERSKLYIYCTYVHIIHLWHCVVNFAYVEAKPHAGNIIRTLCV